MKKVFQDLKNGDTLVENIPSPSIQEKKILIRVHNSLISSGTERMLLNFGKAGYISKALQQPAKVKQVIDKVKTDGIIPTYQAVSSKLSTPIPLGYSCAGTVMQSNDEDFKIGDRVVANGHHADVVSVSPNLCAKVPDSVSFKQASFTIMGSIGLHGIRMINPTLGETIVVIGLGIIGLLSVQILKANGCHVIGVDNDESRCQIAKKYGIAVHNSNKNSDFVSSIILKNNNKEVDAVLITAASSENSIINNSAEICRKRGRVILIGVVGLKLERDLFYKKEILFSVSSAYGPGRYDDDFEKRNIKYPIEFVRWTAQNNFETILTLMHEKKITIQDLVSDEFYIEEAKEAYLSLEKKTTLGILLNYNFENELEQNIKTSNKKINKVSQINNEIAFLGAGNYASKVLLPNFYKHKIPIKYIASNTGENGNYLSKRFKITNNTTDNTMIFNDNSVKNIVISTRHDSHAKLVCDSLRYKRNIFIEKPLCLNIKELNQIKSLYMESNSILMIGFNRRFSPLVKKVKELLGDNEHPKSININVNSGFIPQDEWIQDRKIGGGRIIGEVCHFLDLISFICHSKIIDYNVLHLDSKTKDTHSINLKLKDGSIGCINYFSNGHKSFPKEKIDIYSNGKILSIDNFKTLRGYGWNNFSSKKLWSQDKGNKGCIDAFIECIKNNKPSPIPADEIFEISELSINISNS